MTLKEKYERSLQDSENFIAEEKVNYTPSYTKGQVLAKFFNEELDDLKEVLKKLDIIRIF